MIPALLALCGSSAALAEPESRFSIEEGRIDNRFYRDGPIAAHLLTKSGEDARLVIALPTGNSGVALWLDRPVNWRMLTPLDPAEALLDDGAVRRSVSARFEIDTARVAIRRALTGSIRILRDWGKAGCSTATGRAPRRGAIRAGAGTRDRIQQRAAVERDLAR